MALLQTNQSTPTDPVSFRLRRKNEYNYPPFVYPGMRHECLESIPLPRIRSNGIVVKLYRPEGFTKSGLFVEPKKGPPIWAHVVAFHPHVRNYTHVDINLGDMILFHRYADDPLVQVGDLVLSVVHIKSIQALFTPPLAEMSY